MLGDAAFANLAEFPRESEAAGFGKRMIQIHGFTGFSQSEKPGKEGNLQLLAGVTGVMDFNALRQETFAALATAAIENGATIFGLHAGTETELAFAGAFGRLVARFHDLGAVRISKTDCESRGRSGSVK